MSLSVILIVGSCGGRSGTEIFGYEDRFADASTGGAGGSAGSGGSGGGIGQGGTGAGGTGGSAAGTGGSTDAGIPDVVEPPDAGPDGLPPDGATGGCIGCLQNRCGDKISACYNDPKCVSGIQCMVINCLLGGGGGGSGGGGGGVDIQCVLGCFDNNIGSAMTAVAVFSCITQSCGEECGIGGGGGGGGSGALMGTPFPEGLFGTARPSLRPSNYYIGPTRVPRPEEVASAHPWLAELLAGRMPDPPPPCIAKQRAKK